MIPKRKIIFAVFAVYVLILFGCATSNSLKKPGNNNEVIELMWPEPPLTPRIIFLKTLIGEKDMEKKLTSKEMLLRAITGEKIIHGQLYQPVDIAVSDDNQRIYVSDFGQGIIFLFDFSSNVVTLLGENKPFAYPFGIALDNEENLYIAEQDSKQIVVLSRHKQYEVIRRIAHNSLVRPTDIAIDRQRNLLYVADPSRQSSQDHSVKVFDLEGNLLRTIGNGRGSCDGCLLFPTYITIGGEGNVYVSNTLNARIDVFDSEGNYIRKFGERGTSFGMFDKPKGIALDTFGNVYVVDSGWSTVQIFNQKSEVLLYFGGRGNYPGFLMNPSGITIDGENRIYIADFLNHRICVYQLINTIAENILR